MPAPISVGFDAVDALADELAALAAQLAEERPLCLTAAASLRSALTGDVGWRAGAAATAWGSLTEVLAEECAAMAGTLHAAVASYRSLDGDLARAVRPGGAGGVPVPR
jgi:hypothetical protein